MYMVLIISPSSDLLRIDFEDFGSLDSQIGISMMKFLIFYNLSAEVLYW